MKMWNRLINNSKTLCVILFQCTVYTTWATNQGLNAVITLKSFHLNMNCYVEINTRLFETRCLVKDRI